MLFHLFLLVLIIFTLFFFYTDVMNKINTNKPFAEGMENADTGDTTNNVDDSAPNNLGDKVTYEVLNSFLLNISETCLQISNSSSIIKILDI